MPEGSSTTTWVTGEGKPPYSVPLIVSVASSAAPAPRRLPVPGYVGLLGLLGSIGIGTIFALTVTSGAPSAVLGSAKVARTKQSASKRRWSPRAFLAVPRCSTGLWLPTVLFVAFPYSETIVSPVPLSWSFPYA